MNNPYKNKEKQVLYFIYDPNTKLHKIGIATSQFRFERRFKALKIRYHYGPQLKIILTKVNSKEIIRELDTIGADASVNEVNDILDVTPDEAKKVFSNAEMMKIMKHRGPDDDECCWDR